MCGICGVINFRGQTPEESIIRQMMQKIKHRGPDDEGTYITKNVGLGFVRLSILDLSPLGHQPMIDESGRYVIIHNGEVYNFIEIRDELISKGYIFKSNTDTEVILKAYIEWGESCLHKFNGMWAFCIYDSVDETIFISRDRFGVKPFYFYKDNDQFIFASEITPILKQLCQKPCINNQVLFDYLVFNRTDQTEDTFFSGIKKLQHGHCIRIKGSEFFIKRWYSLSEKVQTAKGFDSPKEYREMLSSAIGLRLRSDVPVGVCLSGGLDSSSIVSLLLKDYNKYDLNTFSAVYDRNSYGDESEYINEFRSELENMFFTSPSAETLFADMGNFVMAHGEPVPATGPYAQYKVMELAKGNVVVTLDGQGADESLAGYHYFYGLYFNELLKKGRIGNLTNEIFRYLDVHRSNYAIKTFLYFLLPSAIRTRARVRAKNYLQPDFVENYSAGNQVSDNIYGSDSLIKALLDHFEYKLEHLLKWEDRNSMFFSLESRVPFLDYRLVENTLACEPSNIIKNGWTKSILRKSMKDILPEKIRLRRDKIGFGTPQAEWFRTADFQKEMNQIINEGQIMKLGIFNQNSFQILVNNHLKRKLDVSRDIWKLINLELWYRQLVM